MEIEEQLKQAKLGTDNEDFSLTTSEENRIASIEMVAQARRSLLIYSYDLDPKIYDNDEFFKVAKELAIYSRFTTIQILFQDPTYAIKNGHILVDLFRRLSSSVDIREIHPDHRSLTESYLIADGRGVIHRQLATRFEATANFNTPLFAREQTHTFTQIWEKSTQHPELRRLHL